MPLSKIQFLKLVLLHSLTAFGGPQAHFAMMLKTFVHQFKIVTEAELMEYNAFCQILPGASSTQTITLLGLQKGGVALAFLTLLIWILPACILMGGFSFILVMIDRRSLNAHLFQFIPALAAGFLLYASYIAFQFSVKNRVTWLIFLISTILVFIFFRNPGIIPAVILVSGIVGSIRSKETPKLAVTPIKIKWWSIVLFLIIYLISGSLTETAKKNEWEYRKPIALFESTYRMGSLVFGGGQVLLPMMYEQYSYRAEAVKHREPNAISVKAEDMYTGMGMVRAMPGPVFSIASFTGGMALKDMGGAMQFLGCCIGMIAIFLPSALMVFFFFPIWNYLKKYPGVYRSLSGINASVTGIMLASCFFILKDISLIAPKTISVWNIAIIIATFVLNLKTKIPAPVIVVACLLLGFLVGNFG